MKKITITWAHVLLFVIIVILAHATICSVKSAKVSKITKPYTEYVNTIRESTDIETLATTLHQAKTLLETCGYDEWMSSVNESIDELNYLKQVKESNSERYFTEMESYKALLNEKNFVNPENIHKLDEHLGASSLYSSTGAICCSWAFVVTIVISIGAIIIDMELYDEEIITFAKREQKKSIN